MKASKFMMSRVRRRCSAGVMYMQYRGCLQPHAGDAVHRNGDAGAMHGISAMQACSVRQNAAGSGRGSQGPQGGPRLAWTRRAHIAYRADLMRQIR